MRRDTKKTCVPATIATSLINRENATNTQSNGQHSCNYYLM